MDFIERDSMNAGLFFDNKEDDDNDYDHDLEMHMAKYRRMQQDRDNDIMDMMGNDRDDNMVYPTMLHGRRSVEYTTPLRNSCPKGLYNFGNTCYMNVIIQCMLSLKSFTKFINSDESKMLLLENAKRTTTNTSEMLNKINESVTFQLKGVFNMLLDKNNAKSNVRPSLLKRCLGTKSEVFEGNDQQDVAEALCVIFDLIHQEHCQDTVTVPNTDELGKACDLHWGKTNSPMNSLFHSMCQEIKSCRSCSYKSSIHCPYALMHLDIPQMPKNFNIDYSKYLIIRCVNQSIKLHDDEIVAMTSQLSRTTKLQIEALDKSKREKTHVFTIAECISNYFKPSNIDCATCSECQSQGYIQKTKISIVPKILTIQIKRFERENKKFNPIELRERINFQINKKDHFYEISAVICHSGMTMYSGHYYMYGKNRTSDSIEPEKWFCFNDCSVSPSSFSEIDISDVYMIFYELVTTDV